MNAISTKYTAACLWFIAGMLVAPGLGAQPSIDMLNKLESYHSSACQLIFGKDYTCSGVLINNTQDPGRPLVLTAEHCIESKEDLDSMVAVFGRRKLLKDQPYAGLEWSNTGASLLSSSRELDFALLELKSGIPVHVAPIYLGWNTMFSEPAQISSIHFPDFGHAHYSFSVTPPSLATFDGLYKPVDSGYWKVDQWARGTTSLGSSGAPLLNENFEIIGGLSGSTDWEHHKSDYFFRLDLAYDQFSDAARQLRAWIDPDKLGRIGLYQATYKIRNYQFTSSVTETVKLSDGVTIAEEFSVSDRSKINGVYVSVGEMAGGPGSTLIVALSQSQSDVHTEEVTTSELTPFSENYIPFVTPPLVRGGFSISVRFNAADATDYLEIPKTSANNLISYFLALNSGKP